MSEIRKIVIIGGSRVGKATLIRALLERQKYASHVEVDIVDGKTDYGILFEESRVSREPSFMLSPIDSDSPDYVKDLPSKRTSGKHKHAWYKKGKW